LIGKTRVQKALFDIAIEHKVSKEHILMKINRLVNWKPFENELSKLYHSPLVSSYSPPRSSVEKIFGTLKGVYGMVKVKYVGLPEESGTFLHFWHSY